MEKMTQLSAIADRKVLVLIDEQNLTRGVMDHHLMLQYDLLAKLIRSTASSAKLHIFIAAKPNDGKRRKHFARIGYTVHVKTIRRKYSDDDQHLMDRNVDNLFAFWAGLFARRNRFDVLILASGDYGLSGELSEAIQSMRPDGTLAIMSLSVPGSTSQGLNAKRNPNIAANLEIGLDLLRPLGPSGRRSSGGNGDNQPFISNPFC